MGHTARDRSNGEQHRYMPGRVCRVARTYHDINIPIEQSEKPHKPLGRETTQFVVPEVGNVRLRNTEPFRNRGLAEALLFDQFVQANRELHTKLTVFGIGKTQVPENVPGAGNYLFTLFSAHISPRSLPWPL